MLFLAGLTRIDAVFARPPGEGEAVGDLILVGPAGGFAPDAVDRVVSTAGDDAPAAGRPVLHLADLLAAVRTGPDAAIGCSIDPVPERQAAMARAAATYRPTTAAGAAGVYRQLAEILGLQAIRTYGVPEGSHFALGLVEADYRMKLIALGLEDSDTRGLPSHLSTIGPGANSDQRFYFVPNYDPVTVNADRTAFALSGPRLKLLTEDEAINADGSKRDAGYRSVSNVAWANRFTEKVPELAANRPTFAALQNLFDLAVAAEIMRGERLADRIAWRPTVLADAAALPVPVGPAPKTVPTAFNTKRAGRGLVIGLIGGGVELRPGAVLRSVGIVPDANGYLSTARREAFAAETTSTDAAPAPAGDDGQPAPVRWWWD